MVQQGRCNSLEDEVPRQRRIPLYPVAPDRPGAFLYCFLVKIPADNNKEETHYKVGFSRDLAQRHRKLTTAIPNDAICLLAAGWFDEGSAMESHIHDMLQGARQERELFTLTAQQRAFLIRLLMTGDPHYLAPDEPYDPDAPAVLLPVAVKPSSSPQHSATARQTEPSLDSMEILDHALHERVERELRAEFDRAPLQTWYVELRTFQRQQPGCLIALQRGRRYVFAGDDAHVAGDALNIPTAPESVIEGLPQPGVRQHTVPLVSIDMDDFDRHVLVLTAQYTFHVAQVVEHTATEQARVLRATAARAIARIITPATTDVPATGPLVAAMSQGQSAALAGFDPLKAEWFVETWDEPTALQRLLDTVDRLGPAEILVPAAQEARPSELAPILELREQARLFREPNERNGADLMSRIFAERDQLPDYRLGRVTAMPQWAWDNAESQALLDQYLDGQAPWRALPSANAGLARRAAAALIRYLAYTSKTIPPAVTQLQLGRLTGTVALDRSTRRNLELVISGSGGTAGTLLRTIDKTMTAMGRRALRERLLNPTSDLSELTRRFDAIDAALDDDVLILTLRDLLGRLGDLDQIAHQLATGRPRPSILMQLRVALMTIAAIEHDLRNHLAGTIILQETTIDVCRELAELLDQALVDVPEWPTASPQTRGYHLIREGYDLDLDQLVAAYSQATAALSTWSDIVRADFLRVCGTADGVDIEQHPVYGMLVVAPSSLVPPLEYPVLPIPTKRGRVCCTHDMLIRHGQILAELPGRIQQAEIAAYQRLCATLAAAVSRLRATARTLALLDVTIATAVYAQSAPAVRPIMVDEPIFDIQAGRHPTVERTHDFVANDVALDGRDNETDTDGPPRLMVITGPNASGKSTVMRQTALIILMAHAGMFVPADRARIGLVDGIFTRIGANDDLVQGRSTFQYELDELRHIVSNATSRSVVIIDEVGRGTDTRNGSATAVGTIKQLYFENHCAGMIATHQHDMIPFIRNLPRLQCWKMLAEPSQRSIRYTYRLVPGEVEHSYGLQLLWLLQLPEALCVWAEQAFAALASESDGLPQGDLITLISSFITDLQAELQGRRITDLPLPELLHVAQRLQALLDMSRERPA